MVQSSEWGVPLFFMFSKRIAIDLGTVNTLVYMAGVGVVLNEPTVVAVTIETNRVVAVGKEAKDMLGRTPGNITAMRPLREGVIADYEITEAMLSYFIDKVCGRSRLFKPEVMVCVPGGVTQVERRAVLDATLSAGARNAYLIDEPLAAAIGASLPIAQAAGHMIVDIGGGSTEAAVISLGGIVAYESIRVGGDKLDEAIANYIKKKFNLVIGERTAEEIKLTIGNALFDEAHEEKKMEVKGRDNITGLPRLVEVGEKGIADALRPSLTQMINGVKKVLEQTPPELAADIIDKGIVLSGGTSQVRNFDKLMTEITGVPCHVAEDPMLCVVKGTGVALENLELYKRSINRR